MSLAPVVARADAPTRSGSCAPLCEPDDRHSVRVRRGHGGFHTVGGGSGILVLPDHDGAPAGVSEKRGRFRITVRDSANLASHQA